jgi:Uncharacterised protein family UPF0005.
MQELYTQSSAGISSLEVSKVLRNTYALLAMTVAFSAVTAAISMAINFPYMGLWMLLPYMGLLYAVEKLKMAQPGFFGCLPSRVTWVLPLAPCSAFPSVCLAMSRSLWP